MRRRYALLAGGALLATGLGLAATTAPPRAAAASMVVYKSQT
jgi:hypothetical protein